MDITETLYVRSRAAWRAWLRAHYQTAPEIWLVSYLTRAGRPGVPYNDAVEEALCFGWIDSVRKTLDAERYARRFSPRRPGSTYSQTNKERLARLAKQGKLVPSVARLADKHRPEDFVIPDDIQTALAARPKAWAFFSATSPSYQRIRAAYVDHARGTRSEFERRLSNLVEKSERRTQFGYGIEDYF